MQGVLLNGTVQNKDPGPGIQDPEPGTQDSRPATQDPGPRSRDLGSGTQDPRLRTQDSKIWDPGTLNFFIELQNKTLKSKKSLTSKRDNAKYPFISEATT